MTIKSRLNVGNKSRTIVTDINVRSSPDNAKMDNIITQFSLGVTMTIIEGPVIDSVKNIYWWKIESDDIKVKDKIHGKTAWIAEFSGADYFLEPVSAGVSPQSVLLSGNHPPAVTAAKTNATSPLAASVNIVIGIFSAVQGIANLFLKPRDSLKPDPSAPTNPATNVATDTDSNNRPVAISVEEPTDTLPKLPINTVPETSANPPEAIQVTISPPETTQQLVLPRSMERWCFTPTNVYDSPNGNVLTNILKHDVVKVTGETPQVILQPQPTQITSLSTVEQVQETWIEVRYEKISQVGNEWTTSLITGWVKETCFDDYFEKFPNLEVKIPHPTKNPNDAQQYMLLDLDDNLIMDSEEVLKLDFNKDKKYDSTGVFYNLCGELCIAYIVKENIDVNSDIESILKKWKKPDNLAAKSSFAYSTIAMTTYANQLSPILKEVYGYTDSGEAPDITALCSYVKADLVDGEMGQITHLSGDEVTKLKIIPSKLSPPIYHALDQAVIKKMLKTHYLIILSRCNLRSEDGPESLGHHGELIALDGKPEGNHWICVDKITRNGTRVEIYNPYPNKRQEYTYNEFVASCKNTQLAGLWIKRKLSNISTDHIAEHADDDFMPPIYTVAVDNPTASTQDAEQYIYIEGGSQPKYKLCGEFSAAFVLGQSIKTAFIKWQDDWVVKQANSAFLKDEKERLLKDNLLKNLQKVDDAQKLVENITSIERGPSREEFRGLVSLMQAYGFNTLKKATLGNPKGVKTFSIDTVLKYWRRIQPNLYYSLIGGENNEPTGPDDLITLLKAYGYNTPGDYRSESNPLLSSPGSVQKKLEEYFLIVGVNIDGYTGRLKFGNKVPHWVVVTKLTPMGNQRGGNRGWVELYNPFPNCWEEYSFNEFSRAYLGPGLWVKRDILSVFIPQELSPAKIKRGTMQGSQKPDKAGRSGRNPNPPMTESALRKIITEKLDKAKKEGTDLEKIIPNMANALAKQAQGWEPGDIKAIANAIAGVGKNKTEAELDITALMKTLGISACPPEIAMWIRKIANTNGSYAEELARVLRESGILSLNFDDPALLDAIKDKMLPAPIQDKLKNQFDISVPASQCINEIASVALVDFTQKAVLEIKQIKHDLVPLPTTSIEVDSLFLKAIKLAEDIRKRALQDGELTIEAIKQKKLKAVTTQEELKILKDWNGPAPKKRQVKMSPELLEELKVLATPDELKILNDWNVPPPDTRPEVEPELLAAINLATKIQLSVREAARKGQKIKYTRDQLNVLKEFGIYFVRKWGDPVMSKQGFDTDELSKGASGDKYKNSQGEKLASNFQAVPLFIEDGTCGGVSNFLWLPKQDFNKVIGLQIEEKDWKINQKVEGYLIAGSKGSIYMYEKEYEGWQSAPMVKWGTIALGGNIVMVDLTEEAVFVYPPGREVDDKGKPVKSKRVAMDMGRLKSFQQADWGKTWETHPHLVHRAYSAYNDNKFGDSPKGIIYTPFFSPIDWNYTGTSQPRYWRLPLAWLEGYKEQRNKKGDVTIEWRPEEPEYEARVK